eukprot:scaffold21106_cov101-Isochrysis_galbana.AAC.3
MPLRAPPGPPAGTGRDPPTQRSSAAPAAAQSAGAARGYSWLGKQRPVGVPPCARLFLAGEAAPAALAPPTAQEGPRPQRRGGTGGPRRPAAAASPPAAAPPRRIRRPPAAPARTTAAAEATGQPCQQPPPHPQPRAHRPRPRSKPRPRPRPPAPAERSGRRTRLRPRPPQPHPRPLWPEANWQPPWRPRVSAEQGGGAVGPGPKRQARPAPPPPRRTPPRRRRTGPLPPAAAWPSRRRPSNWLPRVGARSAVSGRCGHHPRRRRPPCSTRVTAASAPARRPKGSTEAVEKPAVSAQQRGNCVLLSVGGVRPPERGQLPHIDGKDRSDRQQRRGHHAVAPPPLPAMLTADCVLASGYHMKRAVVPSPHVNGRPRKSPMAAAFNSEKSTSGGPHWRGPARGGQPMRATMTGRRRGHEHQSGGQQQRQGAEAALGLRDAGEQPGAEEGKVRCRLSASKKGWARVHHTATPAPARASAGFTGAASEVRAADRREGSVRGRRVHRWTKSKGAVAYAAAYASCAAWKTIRWLDLSPTATPPLSSTNAANASSSRHWSHREQTSAHAA